MTSLLRPGFLGQIPQAIEILRRKSPQGGAEALNNYSQTHSQGIFTLGNKVPFDRNNPKAGIYFELTPYQFDHLARAVRENLAKAINTISSLNAEGKLKGAMIIKPESVKIVPRIDKQEEYPSQIWAREFLYEQERNWRELKLPAIKDLNDTTLGSMFLTHIT